MESHRDNISFLGPKSGNSKAPWMLGLSDNNSSSLYLYAIIAGGKGLNNDTGSVWKHYFEILKT